MERSHEFDPPASNWLARAYYTPLGDALRGNFSARLDVRREIAAAGLPAPISGLIYSVVRRTRLWRSEKVDVARELVAHFSDGLAAGRSAEQLVADFGSTRQAAKLIRKAKRRGRPLYWQTWWYFSRGLATLLGISVIGYALLAVRFYLSRPTVARNYWHEINAARRVPQGQRAWPLYRQALLKLDKDDSTFIGNHWEEKPGGKHWQELRAALERLREPIELAREAARNAGERTIQLRDAAEVAIALELWRRRHGKWPASLDQLVPQLLPAVPPDRYDGQPLRYALRGGQPVIYSIGEDRDDDGGRLTDPPDNGAGGFGPLKPGDGHSVQAAERDNGGWIIWPPRPLEEQDEPE